jgi:thermostable 8-oxoguanine DNA glycosylase
MNYTKKFDFRRQLKDMTLEELESFREKHIDYMLDFIGLNDKEAAKYSRYVGYIDMAIEKKQTKAKRQ